MIHAVRIIVLLIISFVTAGTTRAALGAESSTEQIYGKLAKLPADQRTKQLEEGARKEGSLNFVHTWRGKIARDHVNLFQKRYPFVKVEMGDIGSVSYT